MFFSVQLRASPKRAIASLNEHALLDLKAKKEDAGISA
jgi:hypothetical protein